MFEVKQWQKEEQEKVWREKEIEIDWTLPEHFSDGPPQADRPAYWVS